MEVDRVAVEVALQLEHISVETQVMLGMLVAKPQHHLQRKVSERIVNHYRS